MEREIIALVISAKREAARFGAQSVNFMEETDMNEFSSSNATTCSWIDAYIHGKDNAQIL